MRWLVCAPTLLEPPKKRATTLDPGAHADCGQSAPVRRMYEENPYPRWS